MKILGIMGSPRKNGNTDILISKVLEEAKTDGASTELIRLGDLRINECDGCHACWNGKGCAKNDDMRNLYPEIIKSDVIVFGTPVYWYGPTALMKGFIDRLVYFNCLQNRHLIKDKPVALVIPFEEEDPETVAPVIAFFERCFTYLELDLVAKLIVPGMGRRGEAAVREDLLRKAQGLGKRINKGC